MPISISQLVHIAVKSYLNSEDLLKDAEILFANGRWARTLYLCCIADEETAKSLLSVWAAVRVRLGLFDAAQEDRYRRWFRDHKMKTATLHAVEDFLWSTRTTKEIAESLKAAKGQTADHERIKLSALYADLDGDGAFCPGQFFTAEKVELTLRLSQRRMDSFRGNIVPLFDVLEDCDLERCREWMTHLGIIL
jgi:AbiV family abortive infection protein